ncbi:MAG: hypothetical protein U0414_13735 [Polyangiaceae bacterium]
MTSPPRAPVVAALALVAVACGARTSLEGEAHVGGSGGAGPISGASVTNASVASTATGDDPCMSRTLDHDGSGALVVRTEGEFAFFTTEDGRVMRGDLETGEELALATGKEGLGDLALFEGYAYFSDLHSVTRVPLAGGPEENLVSLPATSYAIAVDASGIYWIDGPSSLSNHEIKRRAPDGSELTLASMVQLPLGLSVGAHGVLFTDPYDFLADPGTVRLVAPEGGPSTLVVESVPYPQNPFQRDDYLYWVEASDEMITNHGGIVRIASDGSQHQKVLPLEQQYPVWAMTDGERYYVTVLDEVGGTHVIAANYPIAGAQTDVASAESKDVFFTMVATTPKRVVWTVQRGLENDGPIDGVKSVCRTAISFL